MISQKTFANSPVITTTPTNGLWQWLTEFSTTNGVYWGHGNGNYYQYSAAVTSVSGPAHLLAGIPGCPEALQERGRDHLVLRHWEWAVQSGAVPRGGCDPRGVLRGFVPAR